MHTYRKRTQDGEHLFTVGYWVNCRNPYWESLRHFAREGDAAAFAAWMNGSMPPRGVLNSAFPDINWS